MARLRHYNPVLRTACQRVLRNIAVLPDTASSMLNRGIGGNLAANMDVEKNPLVLQE